MVFSWALLDFGGLVVGFWRAFGVLFFLKVLKGFWWAFGVLSGRLSGGLSANFAIFFSVGFWWACSGLFDWLFGGLLVGFLLAFVRLLLGFWCTFGGL